jgi:CBS-domain-containing membrane protein
MLQARDIMTREVITVTTETPVAELAKILENRNIGGVPVLNPVNDRLEGIITQSDLVERARSLELPPALNILDIHLFLEIPSHLFQRVEKMLGTTAGEVMSPRPVTVNQDTPLSQIAALMAKEKVHTLPVMERGKIVGIIGKMDIIRALAREEGKAGE